MCYYIIYRNKCAGLSVRAVKNGGSMKYELKTDFKDVLIAEGAAIPGDVSIGPLSSVWYNAVLRGDEGAIEIGKETSIQDCAVVHTDSKIGDHCTIGHGAIVHGATIGNNVLIGMGAILLNGARIADNCLVGAGALVTSKMDAPEGSLILGSPARVIRPCTAEELNNITQSADDYIIMTRQWLDK